MTHNEYFHTFKTAKEIAATMNVDLYSVRLYNNVPDHRYGLPTPGSLGCIVTRDDSNCSTYDIIFYSKSGQPQRISKLHPAFMSLQYLLLFPFGVDGWSPFLKLGNETGCTAKTLTVNMYYTYYIHARQWVYSLLLQSCGLFQQFLVDAYTCAEEGRLSYILYHQTQLRSDYISVLYDALSKGGGDSRVVGKRVFLPASFIDGP